MFSPLGSAVASAESSGHEGHNKAGHKMEGSNKSGSAKSSSGKGKARVITIKMGPVRYDLKSVKVKAGEKIQFRFINESVVTHEAIIGDEKAQAKHEAEMKKNPSMVHHDHPGAVSVPPKSTKTMEYTFGKAGRTMIGCHQPGHYAGGMKLPVVIESATGL